MNSPSQIARNSSSEQSWANIWGFGDIPGRRSRVTLLFHNPVMEELPTIRPRFRALGDNFV